MTSFCEDTTKVPLPTKFLLLIQMRWTMPISTKPGVRSKVVLNTFVVALAKEYVVGIAVEQEEVMLVRTGGVNHSVPAVTI